MVKVRSPESGEEFLGNPRRAVVWAIVLLAAVAVGATLIPAGPLTFDSQWSELMRDIETPLLTHLARIFNALGRGLWRALTLAAIGLVLLAARRWPALTAFSVSEAMTPLLGNVIKTIVDRPRPPGRMLEAHGSSFPSGHAAYASVTAVAVVLLFTHPGGRRLFPFALAATVVAGMAWSRTYLQVHWFSDVVGGATLGLAVALLTFGVTQIVWMRATPTPHPAP